jgi:hypothetical protein
MPSALRAQVALVGLLAVLLIPIGTSSLRGLTHILTCQESAAAPFSIEVPADGPPVVSSSSVIERGEGGEVDTGEVCGGLLLDVQIGSRVAERADVTLAITNGTDYGWRGSVQLNLDDTDIPIDIGHIGSGDTGTETFELRLDSGRTYTIEGTLLVGP